MSNRGFATCVLVLVFALAGCSPDNSLAQHGLDCGKPEQPACRVSFRALAQDSHRFDGRSIRIEGYLGVSRELFVLNSSKELFEAGVTDEVAIRLRGPVDLQERIFQEHAYSWVSLVGTFKVKATTGTTEDLLLGEVFAPLEVRSLMLPLEVRRQSFDDVIINLQDVK